MAEQTIVIVGGGYAGIHTIAALRKEFGGDIGTRIRLILIDMHDYHLEKVVFVKAPVRSSVLKVPFTDYKWDDVDIIQGKVVGVSPSSNELTYVNSYGELKSLHYDRLILALGSVAKTPAPNSGGFTLHMSNDVEKLGQEPQLRKLTHENSLYAHKRMGRYD